MSSLSPDAPLKDPSEDLFSVAPFAETLAEGLLKMFQPEGFVVALHGPWGSGKTTLLNFVRNYLDNNNSSEGGETNPITIIEFNPWWFSGKEDLTRQFFTAFGLGLSKRWKNAHALIKAVGAIAETVSPVGRSVGVVADSLRDWRDPDRKTIHELKEIVNAKLGELGRVLVIIDDIDRLTDPEIREIFQVIKAIGDFSNVIYLLAYDREVVLASLEGAQVKSPDAYLEKIVQASFDLPVPLDWEMRELFLREFSRVLPDSERAILNNEREARVMRQLVSLLDTPRKMKRFLNAYRLSYPVVHPEVNPVDFAGIEAIRILRPDLCHFIQRNEDQFVLSDSTELSGDNIEVKQKFMGEALRPGGTLSPFDNSILNLTRLLFPVINIAFESHSLSRYLGEDAVLEQRRERRISAREKFPLYFRWALPEGAISTEEFDDILAHTNDAELFANKLRELGLQKRKTGESRATEFLDLFYANLNRIPDENIEPVLHALAREGDSFLPIDSASGKYFPRSFVIIPVKRIFIDLLRRVPQAKRIGLLTRVIQGGTALLLLSLLAQTIRRLSKGTEIADPMHLLSEEYFAELDAVTAVRIQKAADDGSLLNTNGLYYVLREWVVAAPGSIVQIRQWVEASVTESQNVVKFIDGLYIPIFCSESPEFIGSVCYQFRFDLMQYLIDPFSLEDIARRMSMSSEISEHQRDMLNDFCRELEQSRIRGKPIVDEFGRDAELSSDSMDRDQSPRSDDSETQD